MEIAVGKVIVTEFISLDGVVEDPGGAEKDRQTSPHWGRTARRLDLYITNRAPLVAPPQFRSQS